MNGKTLFQFNNKNQVTPFGKLTVEENATEVYADLPQSVENILEVMRNQLRNMEPERFKTTGKYGTECKGRGYQEEQSTYRKGAVEVFASKN